MSCYVSVSTDHKMSDAAKLLLCLSFNCIPEVMLLLVNLRLSAVGLKYKETKLSCSISTCSGNERLNRLQVFFSISLVLTIVTFSLCVCCATVYSMYSADFTFSVIHNQNQKLCF